MREIELNLFNRGITAVAGIDEAGRGPLAGPVVAAAAILPPGFLNDLIPRGAMDTQNKSREKASLTLDDSKKLTESKRNKIFEHLLNSNCIYSVQFVDAATIDEIGIKPATHLAMKRAAEEIAAIAEIQHILIDGNDNLPFEIAQIPYEYIIKGDALCDCIAAASVLAKVSRDRFMVESAAKFPQYGFDGHKGYGTAAHIAAIREFGLCTLHRRSFMTAKVLGI